MSVFLCRNYVLHCIGFDCSLGELCWALRLSVCWLGELCFALGFTVRWVNYVGHCLFVGWVNYVLHWVCLFFWLGELCFTLGLSVGWVNYVRTGY